MFSAELEKDRELIISASKNLVKALEFHCGRLQCVVPNTRNFFNEEFIEQIHFVVEEASKIHRLGYFSVSGEVAGKLLQDVVSLRGSVLACSSCIRMTFYESFDFVFNVLIRMLNKTKMFVENFSFENFEEEVDI